MSEGKGRLRTAFDFTGYMLADKHSTRKALVAAGATAAFMAAVSAVAGGNYTSDLMIPAAFVGAITKVSSGAMHVLGHKRQTTTVYHDDNMLTGAFKVAEDAIKDQPSTQSMKSNAIFGAIFGAIIYASKGAAAPEVLKGAAMYAVGYACFAKMIVGLDNALDRRHGYTYTPRY